MKIDRQVGGGPGAAAANSCSYVTSLEVVDIPRDKTRAILTNPTSITALPIATPVTGVAIP